MYERIVLYSDSNSNYYRIFYAYHSHYCNIYVCIGTYAYSCSKIPSQCFPAALDSNLHAVSAGWWRGLQGSEGWRASKREFMRILSFQVGTNINVNDLKVMISRISRIKLLHIFCIWILHFTWIYTYNPIQHIQTSLVVCILVYINHVHESELLPAG